MEHNFFLFTSNHEGSADSDSEVIEVEEDTFLLGGPVGRYNGDNPHSSPYPRIGNVLLFHVRLP